MAIYDSKTYISHDGAVIKQNDFTPTVADGADKVNHPPHYKSHPSGVECITVTEHMNFCRGNAIKYIWRAGEKGNEIEDLEKAEWYIRREIDRLKAPK